MALFESSKLNFIVLLVNASQSYRHGHHDLPGSGERQTDHSSHQISPEQTALCSRSVPVVRDQHSPVLVMKQKLFTKSLIYVCHIYRSVLENTSDRKGTSWRSSAVQQKALGVINKVVATPAASHKAEEKTKPAEAKVCSWYVEKNCMKVVCRLINCFVPSVSGPCSAS